MPKKDLEAPPQPEPPRWRERLFPKSVLGMTVLILALAVGSAFSGVVLYSYYEFQKDETEERVDAFVTGFDERFDTAVKTIEAERENAKAEINKELEPLRRVRAEGSTLEALVEKVQESIWFVQTLDEAGQPSVGSAFAVASDGEQTLLLASYNTVRAATRSPGPQVTVRKGDEQRRAQVWTWQEDRDLALLIIDKGNVPKLEFASKEPPLTLGERIFVVSGLGAAGGAVTQGFVADVSASGIQHDAPVGTAFQGGPILNSDGKVLAVASRAYAPLGFASDGVYFAPPIRAACERVLRCPNDDQAGGAGARR